MTIIKNLFKSYDKNFQIISLIEKGAPFGGHLWQQDCNQKQALEVRQVQTDLEHRQFIIDLQSEIQLEKEQELNLIFFYRRISFALDPDRFKQGGTRLWLNFPQYIQALEHRVADRYGFYLDEDLLVIFKADEELVIGKLIDVSEGGMGIIIPFLHEDHFEPGQEVEITSIDQRSISGNLMATISNCSRSNLADGHVRLGIELHEPLFNTLMEYLKRRSFGVLKG